MDWTNLIVVLLEPSVLDPVDGLAVTLTTRRAADQPPSQIAAAVSAAVLQQLPPPQRVAVAARWRQRHPAARAARMN